MLMDITEVQNLLNTNVTNGVSSGIQDQLSKIIAWTVIPSIVLTLVIIVLYVLHSLRRRKIENAILEIRDSLHDMKLAQVAPAEPWPKPEPAAPVDTASPEIASVDLEPTQDEKTTTNS